MKLKRLLVMICALVAAFANPLAAQETDLPPPVAAPLAMSPVEARAEQVVELFNNELSQPVDEVFDEQFLAAVPPAQLNALSTQFTSQFGRALAVEKLLPTGKGQAALEIRMERAMAKGMIAIGPGPDHLITGLRFTSFEPINDSAQKIEADLRALPGTVSALFMPLGGDPIISIAPDEPLAIGSTFKLYVLAALTQDIAKGKRTWEDVVALETESFPSGMMQDWPKGAPVTLHTLASMMISISDNTATDQLIKVLGRERIEKLVRDSKHSKPELNTPFLTTRELFELKGGDKDRLATYQQASPEVRRQILEGLGDQPVTREEIDAAFATGPVALDVEWLASANDLAALMVLMAVFDDEQASQIKSINESISASARKNWNYVGYKGGSEPGVLNLTWLLADKAGRYHILTLGWNNPDAALDETQLELIAQRILSLPR